MLDHNGFARGLQAGMAVFGLSALAGVWAAYDPALSLPMLAVVLAGAGLYFAAARRRPLARAELAAGVVAAAGLLIALYFIAQYGHQAHTAKSGLLARLGQATTFLPDLHGPLLHPNVAASYLLSSLPIAAAMALTRRRPAARLAWLAAVAIMGYAGLLTASRGAWLAAGAAGAAGGLLLLARRGRWAAGVVAGGGLLMVALLAVVVVDWGQWPLLASAVPRALERGQIYRDSLYLARDYAYTGLGLGDTFSKVYTRYSQLAQVETLTHAHNLPLAVWLGQGLLGLAAFLVLSAAFFGLVAVTVRAARPGLVFHGAWLGVLAALLHGLTDAPQYSGSLWLTLAGLGAAAGLALSAEAAAPPAPRPTRRPSMEVFLVVIVVAVAGLAVLYRPALAAGYTNLGALAETRAELAPGLSAAERQAGLAAAQAWYARALAVDDAWPSANRRLGNLKTMQGDYAAAVPLLETALRQESRYAAATKGLGLAYAWSGRAETAAVIFHQLSDPGAMEQDLYNWGYYFSEQGRPLLTAYSWEAAQAMYPDAQTTGVWLLIAEQYVAAGEKEAARRWYERVLAVEPGQPQAAAALEQLGD
ncbi:MAG: O-antigen ligase family protein [Anaerolineales bacterium]|nr:O-antigen ligase family protein [Anaerolineales bacterium]